MRVLYHVPQEDKNGVGRLILMLDTRSVLEDQGNTTVSL